jgi:hypothetical protein
MASKLLPHNEGKVDRIVRVVIGIALLGVVALLTGLVGSCPLYTLFGLSTCPLPKTTER